MSADGDVRRLARADVTALPHFASADAHAVVDLSDNTNLWGAPPAAVRAIRESPSSALSKYPSVYSEPLQQAMLQYMGAAGIGGVGVVTGCGSDDVLDSTLRAFGAAGDAIAYSSPTFSMVPVLARLNGLEPVAIPLTATFDLDAERLVDRRAKITYVCAPNNPTATPVSRAAVEYVVANAAGIVLLDEAYAEFAPDTFADLLSRTSRLVVARTFSKAFGLAGLRVGYGVMSTDAARLVERARGPYKVNGIAERAVLAALAPTADGLEWMRAHAAEAIDVRQRLVEALGRIGLSALPSAANFVMVPTARAVELARLLRARGVLVRSFAGLPLEIPVFAASAGTALRIGVGPWAMMQAFLDALSEVLACA